jgi:hypothetical protein
MNGSRSSVCCVCVQAGRWQLNHWRTRVIQVAGRCRQAAQPMVNDAFRSARSHSSGSGGRCRKNPMQRPWSGAQHPRRVLVWWQVVRQAACVQATMARGRPGVSH